MLGRVSLRSGTYRLGPDNATLSLRTGRAGAAAKAGHDLVIRIASWEASLVIGEDPAGASMELTADSTALRVFEGTGGMQRLGDDDVANIEQTIDDEILKGQEIRFRSTGVEAGGDGRLLRAEGELTLAGETQPITAVGAVGDDGMLSATAVVTQTKWGMKPYSALFGALKVQDDVVVVLEGQLEPQSR